MKTFRLVDEDANTPYFVVKSVDSAKKSKNIVAILPKCLLSSFSETSSPQALGETFEGLVLEIYRDLIPIISTQPELIALKDEIPTKQSLEEKMASGSTFIGYVNGIVGQSGHVSVRFLDGAAKSIKVKDLNTTANYQSIYQLGKVVRVAVNKLDRLCTKEKVIQACLANSRGSTENDMKVKTQAFCSQFANGIEASGIQLGQGVEAEVQLIKEYGLIAQLSTHSEIKTGFILNA